MPCRAANQVPHRLARPQHKGHFELFGRTIDDRAHDARRLPTLQAAGVLRPPLSFLGQGPPAALAKPRHPFRHRAAGHFKMTGRFGLFHSAAHGLDGPPANGFLCLWTKRSRVGLFHNTTVYDKSSEVSPI